MSDTSSFLEAAFAHHQAGNVAEAVKIYKEIIASNPLQPDALHMMGVIAQQKGNSELALKLIEMALGQRTSMPLAWHNRSLILRALGRSDEALQSAEQAVDLDPNFAEAWDMVGFLRRDKREFERAREAQARAVELRPDDLKFLSNYALLSLGTGDLLEAYRLAREIEERDPSLVSQTLGNILKGCGYPDRAIPYFQKSREILPENDEIRATEAMARLQIGDFAGGWKIWELRPSLDPRFRDVPFWRGNHIDHLLVHEDQGLGDAFQCARYIPELRRYAKRITIQVTKALQKIFAVRFSDCEVLTLDDTVPAAPARIRMLSLPAFFATDATNVPMQIPYLYPSALWHAPWQERLAKIPRPRIGLVWGGNPDHLNDRARSIPFATIEPLLKVGGGHIVSLQKGAQKNAEALAAAGVFDADPYLNDFADTAGLMAELDLVIAVDTSVVHLAGALGKPVWLMLPFDPDWRWLLGREDSPWYPTMRLFRQQEPRNWAEVVERVAADLERYLYGDMTVLPPTEWQGDNPRQNPQALKLPDLNGT